MRKAFKRHSAEFRVLPRGIHFGEKHNYFCGKITAHKLKLYYRKQHRRCQAFNHRSGNNVGCQSRLEGRTE